jgi:hypothetical protein
MNLVFAETIIATFGIPVDAVAAFQVSISPFFAQNLHLLAA